VDKLIPLNPSAPKSETAAENAISDFYKLTSNQQKNNTFGEEQLKKRIKSNSEKNTMTSGVMSLNFNASGKFIVILKNGQQWKQLEEDYGILPPGKKYELVLITRGAFGSYNLVFDKSGTLYKVKRLN